MLQVKHLLLRAAPNLLLNLVVHLRQDLVQISQQNSEKSKKPSKRAVVSILEALAHQLTTERHMKPSVQVFLIQNCTLIRSLGIVSPLVLHQRSRPHGPDQSHKKKLRSKSKRSLKSKSQLRKVTKIRKKRRSQRNQSLKKTKWICLEMMARMKLLQRKL